MPIDMKKKSEEELGAMFAAGNKDGIDKYKAEGEFKRRQLFWVRWTAITAMFSLIVMGSCSVISVCLTYKNYQLEQLMQNKEKILLNSSSKPQESISNSEINSSSLNASHKHANPTTK